MKRSCVALALSGLALAACHGRQTETLAEQRIHEICARDPSICQDGELVAKWLPPKVGVQIEVRNLKCELTASGAQALRLTAHVKNVGDTDFRPTQNINMTATFSTGNGAQVSLLDTETSGITAGTALTVATPTQPAQEGTARFVYDFSSLGAPPAITRLIVQIDPGQLHQLWWQTLTLSWPGPDPSATSATPIDLSNPSCDVSQP